MITETTATETEQGFKATPIDWKRACEILRPLYDGREHWIVVIHATAVNLLSAIEDRYYAGERIQDLTLICTTWRGQPYGLVAMRKRNMLAYQYASLLRQAGNTKISERELLRRDVMVVAPFWLVDGDAMELAARLLDRRNLAMAA
jgi:hypothetical protein